MTDWARARFGLGRRGLRQPLGAERRLAGDGGRAWSRCCGRRRRLGCPGCCGRGRSSTAGAAGGDRRGAGGVEDRDAGLRQRAGRLHDRAAAARLRDLRRRPGARGRGIRPEERASRRAPPPGRRGRGRRSRRCSGAGRRSMRPEGLLAAVACAGAAPMAAGHVSAAPQPPTADADRARLEGVGEVAWRSTPGRRSATSSGELFADRRPRGAGADVPLARPGGEVGGRGRPALPRREDVARRR